MSWVPKPHHHPEMSLRQFIDCLPVLRQQGWHMEGRRIRNIHMQCPLTALAELQGHRCHGSFVRARIALGMAPSDAMDVVSAADAVQVNEHHGLRQWLKSQLLMPEA